MNPAKMNPAKMNPAKMNPAKINPASRLPDWADKPLVRQIFQLAQTGGGEARLVGGAVRDWLAGRQKQPDIDMACTVPVVQMAALASAAGLAVHETGLAHGTITIRSGQQQVELTQTRRDEASDGRHAIISHTDDWTEDAARRDFSINAIYLDQQGRLFDPFAGEADLAAGILRFIGDPDQRLAEDYLRLLRGFRLAAEMPFLQLEPASLAAMQRATGGLARLSAERITAELRRWLGAPSALVQLHQAAGIFLDQALFGASWTLPEMGGRPAEGFGQLDWLARLVFITGPDSGLAGQPFLRFSRAEMTRLRQLAEPLDAAEMAALAGEAWPQAAYWIGEAASRWLLSAFWQQAQEPEFPLPADGRLRQIANFCPPPFPISGADLLQAGFEQGPQLGRLLAELEKKWVAGGFAESRAALLKQVS